jgi:type II secretory pathway pseudopilin PulG
MLLSTHLRRKAPSKQEGYILLFLLLIIALGAIIAATVVTSAKFDTKRDREEEMIHRGVQYTRAIRAYYRKFNRFPAKIEDLENTNQLRFLRKRYKDPMTGKEFKLVHFGEVKFSGGIGGGTIPGANTVGANGQLTSTGFGQNSGFGNSNSFGSNSAFGQNSGFGQNSSFGQNSNSLFSQSPPASNQAPGSDTLQTPPGTPGSDSNGSQQVQANGATDQSSPNQQVFGGAPIVGVASTSKDRTIREFDKKKKYNEWMFVYDPMLDKGGLIKTPYQPQLMMQMMGQGMQNLNGQPNQNQNSSGFGNSNGFGNSGGFGNGFGNSAPGAIQNSPGGYVNSSPPSNNSPQQQ